MPPARPVVMIIILCGVVMLCGKLTKNKGNTGEKPGPQCDQLTDLSTFCPKLRNNPTEKTWQHNTKFRKYFQKKVWESWFFFDPQAGENFVKSVDKFRFLTVSTGFSTGHKISHNI